MTDIEKAGQGGYAFYRIPSLICTSSGALLAAYECRVTAGDWDTRAMGLKRSFDGGKSWSCRTELALNENLAVNNPLLIAAGGEKVLFLYQLNYERTFIRRSSDCGENFSEAEEITSVLGGFRPRYDFNVCAVGPGHGTLFDGGRIIVPVWLASHPQRHHAPSVAACLISENEGETWRAGDIIFSSERILNPNETSCAALEGGRAIFNIRHHGPSRRRAVCYMETGSEAFSEPYLAHELRDPVCFGSLLSDKDRKTVYASGCDSETAREDLKIKISRDGGKSWGEKFYVYGKAGYSDIALSPDGKMLYCFFERDNLSALTFTSFALA